MRAWSFASLSEAAAAAGTQEEIQTGVAEQGDCLQALSERVQPVAGYIGELAEAERSFEAPAGGLAGLGPAPDGLTAPGRLDWDWLQGLGCDQVRYMTRSTLLKDVPNAASDAPVRGGLWPRHWVTFNKVWVGPQHTVTGLHCDDPDNWLCQLRGSKEVVLFPPSAEPWLPFSPKYDFGASVCKLNVLHLSDGSTPSPALASFARAPGGQYARLGPGDALYIPPRWVHCVVSLSPSLSLNSFGAPPRFVATTGLAMAIKEAAHLAGLYGCGPDGCTCHVAAPPAAAAAAAAAAGAAAAAPSRRPAAAAAAAAALAAALLGLRLAASAAPGGGGEGGGDAARGFGGFGGGGGGASGGGAAGAAGLLRALLGRAGGGGSG